MKQLPRFTDITLVLTEQCNLRCPYCYVPKQAPGGRTMTEEVALAAVDRFLDRAPSGKDLSISFFGGEPFLTRGLMERVIDHARKRRPRGLTFSAPTNGTLLDGEAMDGWLEVNRRALDWSDEKVEVRRRLYLGDDRQPRPWLHVLALLHGAPVGAARVLLRAGVAMVHGVATVPEARRLGIGSAVTLAALVDARRRGCRIAVLQASSMGQGPYRRLGFRSIGAYGRFVRR